MNGAQALIRTLVDAGVDTCFMNPGTSEMHFVAALDDVPEMHSVLALFEGVATGAADGYARMAGSPAASLLHLGPGLGNGLANLHNARRGRVPLVNIVGDHATYHAQYDAPLQSDISAIASSLEGWVHSCTDPDAVARDAAAAVAAAQGPPGQVATLILPADVCWLDSSGPATPIAPATAPDASENAIAEAAAALSGQGAAALMVGGAACMQDAVELAGAVCANSGANLLAETFPARLQRGAGRVEPQRLEVHLRLRPHHELAERRAQQRAALEVRVRGDDARVEVHPLADVLEGNAKDVRQGMRGHAVVQLDDDGFLAPLDVRERSALERLEPQEAAGLDAEPVLDLLVHAIELLADVLADCLHPAPSGVRPSGGTTSGSLADGGRFKHPSAPGRWRGAEAARATRRGAGR